MSQKRVGITHEAADRILRLVVVLGFGLTLAACSKCDVPTWMPPVPGQAPQTCHDGPPAQ